nr:Rossmann-like and DUF2520 domain-containing protein [Ornithinimicrobium sp. F0845]
MAHARIAVIGRGRVGTALATALRDIGLDVEGPLGRGADPDGDIVLLCVPDREIPAAASAVTVRPGQLVGHCSGATGLGVLGEHEAFSLHPFMTVPEAGADLTGATAAVAGSSPRALATSTALATGLSMSPVEVRDDLRAAYHASATVASNFLLTITDFAERLGATVGLERAQLVPIVQAAVDNWVATGSAVALTGPIARGDHDTVARQRAAVSEAIPDDLPLFDALVTATQHLARRSGREHGAGDTP